jgi:hypothetical protein
LSTSQMALNPARNSCSILASTERASRLQTSKEFINIVSARCGRLSKQAYDSHE